MASIPFSQILFEENEESKKIRNNFVEKQEDNYIKSKNGCYVNMLKQIFFSNENIEIINRQLILTIFKKTNKSIKIDYQSNKSLNIVMNYIYNEYATNFDTNIKKQIILLNCKIVNELVPKILSEVVQHINYISNIDKIKLLDAPINTMKLKTLPSVTTRF